jgi:hypothetical protein
VRKEIHYITGDGDYVTLESLEIPGTGPLDFFGSLSE